MTTFQLIHKLTVFDATAFTQKFDESLMWNPTAVHRSLDTGNFGLPEQVWVAICVYVAVAILKKTCNIPVSLYTILQVLSVMVFE